MYEILQIIGLCITGLIGVFSLVTMLSRPFKKTLEENKKFREQEKAEFEAQKETSRCLLRDRILSAYYLHYKEYEIKQFEYENVQNMYEQYKKLGGNSFVQKVWDEMQTWTIKR